MGFRYVIRFEAFMAPNAKLVEAWRLVVAEKGLSLDEEPIPAVDSIVTIAGTQYRCVGIVQDTITSYESQPSFAVELRPANPTHQLRWPASGRSVACHPLNRGETYSIVCMRLKNAGFRLVVQRPHYKDSFQKVPVSE